MEVTVEVTQGLERRMTVSIPDSDINPQVEKRLRSIAKTARMEGFRPGKVPLKMITRQYKGRVTAEVMSDLVQSTLGEALSKESIRPVGGPSLQSQDIKDNNVFEYAVLFEVYPEIEIKGLDKIKVELPSVEITGEDVDKMLETLRWQRATWDKVKRVSQKDDRIVISFNGTIEGREFDGGSARDTSVVLGAGSMSRDFEDNLMGLKASEEKVFDVTFPDHYHSRAVAGKTAEFTVKVESVSKPVLPAVDNEFMKAFGVEEGGAEQLRIDIRDNMQRELDGAVRARIKDQLMDGLLEKNTFDVPNVMLDEEIQRLYEAAEKDARRRGGDQSPGIRAMLKDQARRRVLIGLIVAELVKTNDIKLDNDRVEKEIKAIAATYEQPAVIEQAYRDKPELRQGIEALVMENQVVDLLIARVETKKVKKGFYDVVQGKV